jgi:hypothetical protein
MKFKFLKQACRIIDKKHICSTCELTFEYLVVIKDDGQLNLIQVDCYFFFNLNFF